MMTTKQFVEQFNLHDSLLEAVRVNKHNATVEMDIDYCYWMQPDYKASEPETGMILVRFEGVSDFSCDDYKINSDSIVNVMHKDIYLTLTVESDIPAPKWHTIAIIADSVKVIHKR